MFDVEVVQPRHDRPRAVHIRDHQLMVSEREVLDGVELGAEEHALGCTAGEDGVVGGIVAVYGEHGSRGRVRWVQDTEDQYASSCLL